MQTILATPLLDLSEQLLSFLDKLKSGMPEFELIPQDTLAFIENPKQALTDSLKQYAHNALDQIEKSALEQLKGTQTGELWSAAKDLQQTIAQTKTKIDQVKNTIANLKNFADTVINDPQGAVQNLITQYVGNQIDLSNVQGGCGFPQVDDIIASGKVMTADILGDIDWERAATTFSFAASNGDYIDLTDEEARNIFKVAGYDTNGLVMSAEARSLASKMFEEALRADQGGMSVTLRGLFMHVGSLWGLLGDPYEYVLDSNKKLSDYNMEQQPDILADYYSYYIDPLANPKVSPSGFNAGKSGLYSIVLIDFLKDPKNANNLP